MRTKTSSFQFVGKDGSNSVSPRNSRGAYTLMYMIPNILRIKHLEIPVARHTQCPSMLVVVEGIVVSCTLMQTSQPVSRLAIIPFGTILATGNGVFILGQVGKRTSAGFVPFSVLFGDEIGLMHGKATKVQEFGTVGQCALPNMLGSKSLLDFLGFFILAKYVRPVICFWPMSISVCNCGLSIHAYTPHRSAFPVSFILKPKALVCGRFVRGRRRCRRGCTREPPHQCVMLLWGQPRLGRGFPQRRVPECPVHEIVDVVLIVIHDDTTAFSTMFRQLYQQFK